MKTVALIEGFAGGPLHTRSFRRSLTKASFKVIRSKREASIIIAHSAGIYGIPKNAKAKLVMLIGPTYWPKQKLVKRVLQHTASSRRYHVSHFGWSYYIWKKILELYYFFTRNRYMWLGIKNNNQTNFIENLNQSGRKILLVRNLDDPFCGPEISKLGKNLKNVQYIELPGVHDDYVKNHAPYIELIKKVIDELG